MSPADPTEDPLVQRQRLYEYEAEFEAQNAALQEAYQELNRSRDRYRALFEESPVAFALIEPDTTILQVNAQAEEMLGRGRDSLVGRTLMNRVNAVHHVGLRTNLDIAVQRGRRTTTIVRLAGDDVETWVRVDCGRLDLGGEQRILIGLRDITRQHLAEDALRTSEARFRALFEASLDAVALLDGASLTLQEVNPAFVRLTGVEPEELIGQRIRQLFPEDHRWAVSATLRQALHRGAAGPLAVALEREDSGPRRVELSATAVRVGGGLFAMVSLRDVHEQWLAVQRRRATERQLWEVQKVEMLGAMAGDIAQDVNESLATIHDLARSLLAGLDADVAPPEQVQGLRAILEATGRSRDLTRTMLGLSGRGDVEHRTLDLLELLQQTCARARHGLTAGLELEVDPDLGPLLVRGDPAELEHALLNLLHHATTMQPRGPVRVQVDVQRWRTPQDTLGELAPGRYVRVRVVDDGQGLDPQALAAVFEPGADAQGVRAGLALGLVRTTIEAHGGAVDIDSTPGRGTCVSLWLPRLAHGTRPPAEPEGRNGVEASVHRLLVIDDEPMVLRATTRMLASDGYRVHAAGGRSAGLEAFRREGFDAALVDLSMPGMDGEAVLREMVALDTDAVLVGMTGHVQNALPADLAPHVAAVLRKPFGPDDLRRVLAILDLDGPGE